MTHTHPTINGLPLRRKLFGKPLWLGRVALFSIIFAFCVICAVGYAIVSPAVISKSLASVMIWSLWVSFGAFLIVVIGVLNDSRPKQS